MEEVSSDPLNTWPLLQAMAGAAAAAFMVLLWNLRPREARPWPISSLLGAAIGFYAGCRLLGHWPHWPPAEDRDRLLFLVIPSVIIVELLTAVPRLPGWLAWVLRLPIVIGSGRVLLHGSVYLTQAPGPDSLGWTPAQRYLILGGMAVALGIVWWALNRLVRRAPGRSVPIAIACSCAGTAVAIMLSGYATAVPTGLLLASAIFGSVAGSLLLSNAPDATGLVALGVVGLFSLVVVGRFFGELRSLNAGLLFLTPLMCWIPELPYLKKMGPRSRGVARIALTVIPLAVVFLLIQHAQKPEQVSPGAEEPGLEDYQNFGK